MSPTDVQRVANLMAAYVRLLAAYQTLAVNFAERTARLERELAACRVGLRRKE